MKIKCLEGLRGMMAIWILVTHVMQRVGLELDQLHGIGRFLRSGGNGVSVFIVLSGFVIFLALDKKKEGYSSFIGARFFRLFPLLVVATFFSLFLYQSKIELISLLPSTEYFIKMKEMTSEPMDYLWLHLVLKLSMLHGIVPNQILVNASNSILEPAWSISLEWQFYLLAPFLFLKFRNKKYLDFVLIILALVFPAILIKSFTKAFIGNSIHWFCIGIVSWYFYKSNSFLKKMTWSAILFSSGIFYAIIDGNYWSGPHLPLLIWSVAFFAINRNSFMNSVLESGPAVFFGKISYSIYLLHMPVIVLIQTIILNSGYDNLVFDYWTIQLSVIIITIPLAFITYNHIEMRFISIYKSRIRAYFDHRKS